LQEQVILLIILFSSIIASCHTSRGVSASGKDIRTDGLDVSTVGAYLRAYGTGVSISSIEVNTSGV
jgi:predicted small secreted protein